MKTIAAVLLLVLFPVPCMDQTPSFPNQQQIFKIAVEAEAVFTRFEQVTDRINFNTWNVPYGVSSSDKNALDQERASIRGARASIARLKTGPNATALDTSGLDLLDVNDELSNMQAIALILSHDATNDPTDIHLGGDLVEVAAQAYTPRTKLKVALTMLLVTEQAELAKCREGTK